MNSHQETRGTTAKQDQPHHHIVMLPFLAQGHLIPFLALANRLAPRHKITIATTPLNSRYLSTAIAKNSSSSSPNIHLFTLPFNSSDHDLPPDTENTESLPLSQIVTLFHASSSLELPFRHLIDEITDSDGRPPLCIISDVFTGWANEIARSCSTTNVTFTTGGAYGTAAYVSLWQHLPHRRPSSSTREFFTLPGFPESCVFHITQLHRFLREADGDDTWSRFFQPQIAHSLKSSGWICNTAEEIEPLGLDVLRRYTKLPVWCVGPLIPPKMASTHKPSSLSSSARVAVGQHTGREFSVSPEECLQFLDQHGENSVVYVSFGSQNTISPSQMMALAMGLEDSNRPFIWAIRPPFGFSLKSEFRPEWLPERFEERTARNKKGLVVHGWAPQLEILCHKSTGAFVSHCGWNSIMESLSQGVPLVGWPLAAEQGYNAKMLVEEMGVCMEIARGVQSDVRREEVREVIEKVMGSEEMREKAGEIGELIRAALSEEGDGGDGGRGSSHRALDDFVAFLLSNKGETAS